MDLVGQQSSLRGEGRSTAFMFDIQLIRYPGDNLSPSLYEFYLVMIYRQQTSPAGAS